MYYIYGAIFETQDDRTEISKTVHQALEMGYSNVVSLNPLIPKPGTPFENMPMESVGVLRKLEREIRSELMMEESNSILRALKNRKLQFALASIDREKEENYLNLSSVELIQHLF